MKSHKLVLPLDKLFYFFERSGTKNRFPLRKIYVAVGNREWLLKEFYIRFYEYLLKFGWPPLKKEEGKRKPQIFITTKLFDEIKNLQNKGMHSSKIMENLKKRGWKIIPDKTSIINAMNRKEYYTGFSFSGLRWVVDFLKENLKGIDYQISKRTILWYVEGKRDPSLLHIWLISKRLGISPAELQEKLEIRDMHFRKPEQKFGLYVMDVLINSPVPLPMAEIRDRAAGKVPEKSFEYILNLMRRSGYLIQKKVMVPKTKQEITYYAINGDFKKLVDF